MSIYEWNTVEIAKKYFELHVLKNVCWNLKVFIIYFYLYVMLHDFTVLVENTWKMIEKLQYLHIRNDLYKAEQVNEEILGWRTNYTTELLRP